MEDQQRAASVTTGLPDLDDVLHGLIPGDNLVWDVEDIDEYRRFVLPLAAPPAPQRQPPRKITLAHHPKLQVQYENL